MADGIEAAWRTDLLEELPRATARRLAAQDGVVSVLLAPFETVTVAVRPWQPHGLVRAAAAKPGPGTAAVAPPEPVQPVYARYWLHGKGPAPAGNVPVAVHFAPTRITLNADSPQGRATLTGPRARARQRDGGAGGAGRADSGDRRCPGAGSADGGALRYDLPANGFASWDVAARAAAGTTGGRYFITARITDRLGQALEDTALVTVGEAGGPDASLEPEELFFRLQSDVMALAGEADLELLTPELRLTPGASRPADGPGRQPPGLAAAGRGPAGLPGRHLADDRAVDAVGRGRARRRGHRQLYCDRPGDGRTRLGVLAAGQADVLRPGSLLPRGQAHRHRLTPGRVPAGAGGRRLGIGGVRCGCGFRGSGRMSAIRPVPGIVIVFHWGRRFRAAGVIVCDWGQPAPEVPTLTCISVGRGARGDGEDGGSMPGWFGAAARPATRGGASALRDGWR